MPIRSADADRLRQLEASILKLEEEIRELKDEARESDEAMEARAKQHMKDYEASRNELRAERQAVRELECRLNESKDRHKAELAALASQHQKDLAALESQHKKALGAALKRGVGRLDPEAQKLFKNLSNQIEANQDELKEKETTIQEQEELINKYKREKAAHEREIEELKNRRASVPGGDPQPDHQRSSSVSVKTEPECYTQPDEQRSSNVASLSSSP